MSSKRFEPAVRQQMILKAAIALAQKPGGWSRLTRQGIAKAADCSDALVSRYLGDMPKARKRIMKEAIKDGLTEIIIQSVAAHDGYAPKNLTITTSLLG